MHLPCRRISNNLCSYFALKELECNFSMFNCGLCIVNFFQDYSMEKGLKKKKSRFRFENFDKHSLSQAIKVNTNCDKSCLYYVLLI